MNQAENENVRKKIILSLIHPEENFYFSSVTNEVRKTRIEFIKSKNR